MHFFSKSVQLLVKPSVYAATQWFRAESRDKGGNVPKRKQVRYQQIKSNYENHHLDPLRARHRRNR
jgi:hypothetical protein